MASKTERLFEKGLWNFRFIILIAVIALLASSLIAFAIGLESTIKAGKEIFSSVSSHQEVDNNKVIVYLISSLDEFLLGIILIIISLGIYELFISEIDTIKTEKGGKGGTSLYPKWLTFHSLEELKAVLTKVIIIILMVYFFKSVVLMKFTEPLSILYLAISILLIALANYFSHRADHTEKKEPPQKK